MVILGKSLGPGRSDILVVCNRLQAYQCWQQGRRRLLKAWSVGQCGRHRSVSHFEYISVALSLFFALVLAKLLGGLPAAVREERRYWIHLVWVVNLVLACLVSWRGIWEFREINWLPGRFFAVFVFPAVLYLRAAVLLTEEPREVTSWRRHYYESRRGFFLLGALGSLNLALSPMFVMDVSPPLIVPLGAAAFAGLSVLAAFVASPRLHAVVAVLFLLVMLAYPFVTP